MTGEAAAQEAIHILRFRAACTGELARARTGYRIGPVDAFREEAIEFAAWAAETLAALRHEIGALAAASAERADLAAQLGAAREETARLEERLAELGADLTAAREHAAASDALSRRVTELEGALADATNRPDRFEEMGAEVADMLRAAAEAAAHRRDAAEREAAALLDRTQAFARRVEQEARTRAEAILAAARAEAALVRPSRPELLPAIDLREREPEVLVD